MKMNIENKKTVKERIEEKLSNEKKKEVCKEYIIPNKFDFNLIKNEN